MLMFMSTSEGELKAGHFVTACSSFSVDVMSLHLFTMQPWTFLQLYVFSLRPLSEQIRDLWVVGILEKLWYYLGGK